MTFDEYNESLPKPHSYRSLSYFAAKEAFEAATERNNKILREVMSAWVESAIVSDMNKDHMEAETLRKCAFDIESIIRGDLSCIEKIND